MRGPASRVSGARADKIIEPSGPGSNLQVRGSHTKLSHFNAVSLSSLPRESRFHTGRRAPRLYSACQKFGKMCLLVNLVFISRLYGNSKQHLTLSQLFNTCPHPTPSGRGFASFRTKKEDLGSQLRNSSEIASYYGTGRTGREFYEFYGTFYVVREGGIERSFQGVSRKK